MLIKFAVKVKLVAGVEDGCLEATMRGTGEDVEELRKKKERKMEEE